MSYTLLPLIRRARDYHLYSQKGERYLDLYQDGGRAILGHKPRNLYKILKNEMQKGLMAEIPSVFNKRFEKAILRLTGENRQVRIYSSFENALAAAQKLLGKTFREKHIQEPFFIKDENAPVYFRPFTDINYSRFPILFPVLPFPGSFAPQSILIRKEIISSYEKDLPSDSVSPVLLAGLLHLTEELQKEAESPDIWKSWKLPEWKRFGCYCFPRSIPEDYTQFFNRFLAEGIIISPNPERPILLPRIFSPGEQSIVERLAAEKA